MEGRTEWMLCCIDPALLVFRLEPLGFGSPSSGLCDIFRSFPFWCSDGKRRAFLFSFSPTRTHEASRALGNMWLCSKHHLQKDGLGKASSPEQENISGASDLRRADSISPTTLGSVTNLIRQPILLLGKSPAKPSSCKNKYSSANILIS